MNTEKSYLCPLFWQHHEEETVLREELQRMKENGIGGFIVEARPHPDYLEENWWKDLTILLDEAKKLDIEMWIFDDGDYPSEPYLENKIPDIRYCNNHRRSQYPWNHINKWFRPDQLSLPHRECNTDLVIMGSYASLQFI